MTEKRFKYEQLFDDYNHADVYDGKKWIGCCHIDSAEDFCKAFNELADENERLKERRHEDINDLSVIAMKYQALEKENEELKDQIAICKDANTQCCNEYSAMRRDVLEYQKKNEELKSKIDNLQETLSFRSNQLALLEKLIDDLGSEEMARQMEEILND